MISEKSLIERLEESKELADEVPANILEDESFEVDLFLAHHGMTREEFKKRGAIKKDEKEV